MIQETLVLHGKGIAGALPAEFARQVRIAARVAGTAASYLRLLTYGAALGALTLWGMIGAALWPLVGWEVLLLAIGLAAVFTPPWMLWQGYQALEEVAALPEHIANLVDLAQQNGEELQRILHELHGAARAGLFPSITTTIRLARSTQQTRVFAEACAPLLQLLELQFIGVLVVAIPCVRRRS